MNAIGLAHQRVDSASKLWGLAHNAYNDCVTDKQKFAAFSQFELENIRLYAVASYEGLLDAMDSLARDLALLKSLAGDRPPRDLA